MQISFGPRGMLQIDDARLTHKNFKGEGSKFNREGDRNFSLIIDDAIIHIKDIEEFGIPCEQEIDERIGEDYRWVTAENLYDLLRRLDWNIKRKESREEGEKPFMYLPVKIKFNDRGPSAYFMSGNKSNKLTEETIAILDDVYMSEVNVDIRPYDWEVQGKTGRTAYLHSIEVTQEILDRFAERHGY